MNKSLVRLLVLCIVFLPAQLYAQTVSIPELIRINEWGHRNVPDGVAVLAQFASLKGFTDITESMAVAASPQNCVERYDKFDYALNNTVLECFIEVSHNATSSRVSAFYSASDTQKLLTWLSKNGSKVSPTRYRVGNYYVQVSIGGKEAKGRSEVILIDKIEYPKGFEEYICEN